MLKPLLTSASIAVWLAGAILAVSWAWGIRFRSSSGRSVNLGTAATAAWFAISMVIATLCRAPFHLLWMFPASVAIGQLSAASLARKGLFGRINGGLGRLYATFLTVGINMHHAMKKRAVVQEFGRLVLEGQPADDAFMSMEARYPALVTELGREPFAEEEAFVSDLAGALRAKQGPKG